MAAAQGRHVRVAGLDLFVRERGRGRPLLLLNGIGANTEMWGPLLERLSRVARTVAVDAPGSGRSSTPALPQSIADVAAVTAALLDELGHDEADVLGYSFGGLVAQELARHAPGRIGRMALVGTACGWGGRPGTLSSLALVSTPIRYRSRAVYERTNVLLSPADSELVTRLPALTEARLRHPPPLLGYWYQLAASSCWSSLAWLPHVRTPTLVLAGALDHLVPSANGVQLARLLPNGRLHVLPSEGHLLVFDPQSASQALLEDFFGADELDRSAAWTSATVVDDDDVVEQALRDAVGSTPHAFLSDAYRHFVRASA